MSAGGYTYKVAGTLRVPSAFRSFGVRHTECANYHVTSGFQLSLSEPGFGKSWFRQTHFRPSIKQSPFELKAASNSV